MPVPIVILAAGRGERLQPWTRDRPKCLVPVGPTSPLDHLLAALGGSPPSRVLIVSGHAEEWIRERLATRRAPYPVETLFNSRFASANNIVSVAQVLDRVPEGFLLVNSDLLCHPRIVARALADPPRNALVVDPSSGSSPEAMKVRAANGRLQAIGKNLDPAICDGEYIGIARFDSDGVATLGAAIREVLAEGGEDEWYEAAIDRAAGRIEIGVESTGGLPWIEIDDAVDLGRAEAEVLPSIRSSI